MKAYYFLSRKRTNSKGKTPIYCRITGGQNNFTSFSTGIFIDASNWSENDGWVKPCLQRESKLLHNLLQKVDIAIAEAEKRSIQSAIDIAGMVKHKPVKIVTKPRELMKEFVAFRNMGAHSKGKLELAISEYEQFTRLSISALGSTFPVEFEHFLMYTKKLSAATIKKRQQLMRRMFEYAVNKGYIAKNPYALYQMPKVKPAKKIRLSNLQLEQLRQYKFAQERLEKVRDLFIFQCYTGFAYADLVLFTREKIQLYKSREYIVGRRKKTETEYHIPYTKEAKTIAEKYDFKLPFISNQKYNSYLKEIAGVMGWDIPLTTHVGRKTFSQLMINKGFSWEAVAAMMGHEKTTMTETHYADINIDRIEQEYNRIAA